MKIQWKVEWLDQDGVGHWEKFDNPVILASFIDAIKPLCMLLDVYKRQVTEWERQ